MKQPVDFEECLKDSPRFRYDIEQNEQDINTLESILERLFKLCNNMVDTGKAFNSSTGALIGGIETLVRYFDEDKLVTHTLKRFTSTLTELQTFFKILMDQAQRSIATALHFFVKEEIKKVKDTKKVFDKISDDLDNAYMRNAHLPKTCKPTEAEEAKNILTAMHSCFSHTSLDYAFQINILQSHKRIVVLDKLLTFMHAQYSYFSQGFELMKGLDSEMKDVERQVLQLSSQFTTHKKEMEERHTLVQKKEESGLLTKRKENDPSGIVMEGYLFKRSSNAFKSWHRRWFMVQYNQLSYRKRSRDDLTVLADDLRLCQMKNTDDLDRRFCFELVSPTKSWYLQADSDFLRQEWIEAMQACIKKAFSESKETDSEAGGDSPVTAVRKNRRSRSIESIERIGTGPPSILLLMKRIPGNNKCCDCGNTDPKWASINLGITLCIECSGIHRSLGVHLSKVRSLTLDAWEPEHLKLMSELGNDLNNNIYEANIGDSVKPTQESNRLEKETWIKSKYVQHQFVSLELFLKNYRRLDRNLIKTLAVMKVYHERKRSSSESKVGKIFKRKGAVKTSFLRKGKKEKSKNTDQKALDVKIKKKRALQDEEYSSGADSSCDTDTQEAREPCSGHEAVTEETTKRLPMDSLVSEIINSSGDKRLNAMLLGETTTVQQDTDIVVDKNNLSPKPPLAEEEQDTFSLGSSSKSSFEGLIDDAAASRDRLESRDSLEQDMLFKRHSVAFPLRGAEQGHTEEEDDEHLEEEREKAVEVLKHLQPNRLLYKAAEWKNLPLMAAAFAEGARVNWVNEEDDSKTPLHQSVLGGSLAACEFLMQNGAKVNLRDARGRGALHHAALLGQTGPTCLFLKRGANQHAVDENGEDPLTIALKQTNADIVTLLRIARLNDEMKEGDELMIGMSSDETFANVFRDFSNMASTDPERLKRNFDPDRQSNV